MKAPLEMPYKGASRQQFELQRVDYMSPEASGRVAGVQAGFPLWFAIWTLTEMRPEKSDEWRAFLSGLRGQTRRLLGSDRQRPLPLTGLIGVGDASSWSETINADGDSELTLNGIGAAQVLSQGDYIGFRYTATETSVAGIEWHALVRVVEGATASGGGNVTVIVEPPVPSAVPITAVAYLDTPKCVMALLTDQTRFEAIDRRGAIRGGTLTAIQDIRE